MIDAAAKPLADRMRPRALDEYIGQKHLIAPGKPLSAGLRPWSEPDLLDHFLRPAAAALALLAGRGMPHRAIRLDNIFRAGPGLPIVLGAAWAAPPAASARPSRRSRFPPHTPR